MSPQIASHEPFSLRPRDAWRALQTLLKDPEDTAQVFEIVRALSGKTLLKGYNRFSATQAGEQILREQKTLLHALEDRARLRQLPEDSLGGRYLAFVELENLSADGLVAASESAEENYEHPGLNLYAARLRDMHDLWHVVTGYGRDNLGEVCLLGFTHAQTRSPGIALIALAGAGKIAREQEDKRVFQALWDGYQAGRKASWLPAADWESLLAMPLAEVRERLHIEPRSTHYPAIVAAQQITAAAA